MERSVEPQCLVQISLSEAELVPVGMKDPAIGEDACLAQAISGRADQCEGAAAVFERFVKATDANVDDCALLKYLSA